MADADRLQAARSALADLERALEAHKRDILPKSRANYRLLAEPLVGEIRKLRAEIDGLTGLTAAVREQAVFWIELRGEALLDELPARALANMVTAMCSAVESIAHSLGPDLAREAVTRATALTMIAGTTPLRIGLRLPDSPAAAAEAPASAEGRAREAALILVKAALWAAGVDGIAQLTREVPDAEARRHALEALAALAPHEAASVESVTVDCPELDRSAALTGRAHARIAHALGR